MTTGRITNQEALALAASDILALDGAGMATLLEVGTPSCKKRLNTMLAAWHPDRNTDPAAGDVLRVLLEWKSRSAPAPAAPDIAEPATCERVFHLAGGSARRVRVLSERHAHAGDILVTPGTVARVFAAENVHLAGVGECFVSALPFADDRMRKDLAPALPQLLSILPLEGGDRLEIYRRPQGSILLQDLLDHGSRTGRCFAPRDLAWVVSGLMSIAEWLDWAGQAHGCIDATSVFVNPETQAVALLGGWEFSVPFGQKPAALPKRTLELLPQMQLGGRADGRIALKQIQALGRDLLGFDAGGTALPEPVQRWLSWPRSGEVQRDHAGWIAATEEAWGPHKLMALGVSESDVYHH